MDDQKNQSHLCDQQGASLGGFFQHVVSVPSRDGDESNSLGVVTDLFDEVGGLLDDFIETLLTPLRAE